MLNVSTHFVYLQITFIVLSLLSLSLSVLIPEECSNITKAVDDLPKTVINLNVKKPHGQFRLLPSNDVQKNSENSNAAMNSDTSQQNQSSLERVSNHDVFKDGFFESLHDKCPRNGKSLKLIIVIISSALNYRERMAVRETWGQYGLREDARIVFLLGIGTDPDVQMQLAKEEKDNYDIVQGNFLDTISSDNSKLISALEWVGKYCSRAKFMLKTHDDVFINMPRLMTFARLHMSYGYTIFARFKKNDAYPDILRTLTSFTLNELQPMLAGHTYLLTSDSIHDLFFEALQKKLTEIGDTYLIHTIGRFLDIACRDVEEFICSEHRSDPCNLYTCISLSNVSYSQQYDLWTKLFTCDQNCSDQRCYQTSGNKLSRSFLFILSCIFCTVFS